jgi:hypothetical protein
MNARYGQLTVELACVVTSQFHMAPSGSQVFSDYNSGLDNLNQVALNWGFDMLSKGRRSPRDAHLSPPGCCVRVSQTAGLPFDTLASVVAQA